MRESGETISARRRSPKIPTHQLGWRGPSCPPHPSHCRSFATSTWTPSMGLSWLSKTPLNVAGIALHDREEAPLIDRPSISSLTHTSFCIGAYHVGSKETTKNTKTTWMMPTQSTTIFNKLLTHAHHKNPHGHMLNYFSYSYFLHQNCTNQPTLIF